MKTITLPDGEDADFPDSMSDDDILRVLRAKFPAQPSPGRRDVTPFKAAPIVEPVNNAGRGVINPPAEFVARQSYSTVKPVAAAPEVLPDYSPSGDDFGSAIMSAAAPANPNAPGIISRIGSFLKPEPKSVLENYQPSAEERQTEIDKRLAVGAGPISQQTLGTADLVRSTLGTQGAVKSNDATVNRVVKLLNEKKAPAQFADVIERANNPATISGAQQQKANEFRTAGEWAADTLSAVGQGATSLIQLPTAIIAPGSSLAKSLQKTQEELQAQESDVLKAQRAELTTRVQNEDGFLGKYFETVRTLVTNPAIGLSEATKQVPNFLGVLGAAKIGAGLTGLGVTALEKASPTFALGEAISGGAVRSAATATGANVGGFTGYLAQTSGDAAQSTYARLTDPKQTDPAIWDKNPDYQKLRKEGKTREEAIDEIATAKARLAAVITAPLAVFGYAGAEAAMVARGAGQAAANIATPAGAAKMFAKDIVGENIEEGGTQLGSNIAIRLIDQSQKLLEGVPEAMATATVTSAPFAARAVQAHVQDALRPAATPFDVVGDLYARRALDVQSYDAALIKPYQTAKVQQDQTSLQQSTTADAAAAAADSLSGSVDELLVPGNAITPLPLEPTFRVGEMTPSVGRAGPGFDAGSLPGFDLGTQTAVEPAPEISTETEQQFGLDKLRINAPRPRSVQGTPVADLTDDQLQAITGDESVAPISRRSAAIELTARQDEAGAFTQRAAPQQTAAPSTVSSTRTMTPEELGAMPIRDRRALASQFDQTENEDGTITFTTKPASSTQVVSIPPLPGTEQTLGTAPVRDVGNQPVLDNETVRADAQRSLDRWAVDNGQAIPAKLNPAPEAEDRAVSTIANLLGSQFGTRAIAFHDTSPGSVQGVAVGGTAFVNTANVVTNISKVSLHELKHTIEQIAFTERQAGLTNTSAQKFTAQIDSIFDDMTEEGKRAYVTNFLHAAELAALDSTPDIKESRIQEILQSPVLRSEMTADFMGNRATDKAFWADVAQADPGGFKGFVQKWVSVIDNLMATLRGKPTQVETESAKVDQYVRDLGKAKMVAREALIAYRQGTLQQFESAPAASLRQGEINAPTVTAAGSENLPGPAAQDRPGFSKDGGGPTPSYGTARAGAISVVGRHYSTTPRQTLSGAYYGQGLKGAERTRLDSSTDPRLKNRVYFYVDQGAGIRPESGVGGYAHETKLDNIYDPQTQLIKPQADANAFESAVINAGFDGYIAPFGNGQSAVVLLGQKHKAVPVKQIGQPRAAALPAEAAPTTLKKGLLSREASQVDTGNIPGSRMRMGTLEIPAGQVEAANTEMARIGSQIRFSKKEMVGPPAPEVKDTGVYRDVADKIKMSAAEYNASMLPLMTGKTGDNTFKTPKVGGIPEVVQWLTNRRMASGLPVLNIKKAGDRTTLAKLMASEAVAAIRSAGNAVEWYDETVAKTLQIMAVKYPELNSDPNARNAFLISVAISSQTMNVEDNLRYASAQYEAFRKTGKFPEVGTGKSAPAMAKNFSLANKLLAEFGADDMGRFLQTAFTKRELEMSGFKIGGESMDENLLGSAVFGPKIGFGFYSNLAGNFEPVTMDMWFMRTLGRLTGTLPAFDPVLFPKQVAKLRAALAETGPAERGVYAAQFDPAAVQAAMETDEGAIALARQISSLHNRQFIKERAAFDSGTRIKTSLIGAADSIIKSADKPTDAPGSGGERQLIRDVVRQMVVMVEEQTGKRVPPAALQALIWYPEQELYKNLGVKLRVTSQDYAGAAESLLQKEGFDGQQLRTAAESGPGRARQVAGQPNTGATGPSGKPTGGAVPFQGKEREDFIGARTDRFNATQVVKQPLKKIFEDLAKRGLAKTRAEAAFTARPDGAQIKYVQENFHDILIQLEDADKVKINCK